jgi:hypothetical protein
MNAEPMTVAEQAQAFDVRDCAECRELRAEIEPLLDGDPTEELEALRRWQQHKDNQHPLFSHYLRRTTT